MGLITVIFLLFLATVAGFVQFTGGGIQFRAVLTDPRTHALVLPAVMHTAQFHGLLIAGLTLCVVLPLLSPIRASLATLLASAVPLYLGIADTRGSLLLPMEFSLLALGVIFAVNVLIAYFRETHSRQQVLSLFGQFVPPQLVEQIARDPKRFSMEGEAKRVTIFFCDLQDFSGVAEQLNPRQLTLLLNEYFDAMTEVLHRHGATIDKYIGDCIMAFWGAPVPQEDHAQRAVLASFEMQKTIAWLREGYLRRGWPAPLMGIGINTGVVSVGNMGSRYRIAYTVIGDAVNLAARLEALTRTYHVPTLVSEATRADCKDVVFRTLDIVQVRGKHNRTLIFEPVCRTEDLTEARQQQLREHEAAVELFLAGDMSRARERFRQLHEATPDDPVYPVLLRKTDEAEKAG
ncbi:MAG: adenylate/guanylate cyclase domain-containing protein [Gammaproteobacteria bacterium]|nr:adenylate/guanylate cyclase domain-containing protein [Gammaproteobacteria bacterium]